ncbi:MAG: hypothetical protein MK085_13950 [Phycisphaerales bacterium]|nr:hypothetical protein [Phycisphaerales bacterium]
MSVNTEEEADAVIMTIPPLVEVLNDEEGMQILSEEGLPITISVDETIIEITPEIIEIEAPDINLTAEAAVEVEAGADFDLTVGGAVEVESPEISVASAAVEFEAGLFTVL